MTTYTIVDASGEILSSVDVPDAAHLTANTPAGCTAIPGEPASWNSYFKSGAWVAKPPSPGPIFTWDPIAKIWSDQRTLPQAQAETWQTIQAARDAAMSANFVWDGSVFQGDAASQTKIQGDVLAAVVASMQGQTFSASWTLFDNTQRTLSGPDMIAVGQALQASMTTAFAQGVALRAQIEAATTLSQLDAITWPTSA